MRGIEAEELGVYGGGEEQVRTGRPATADEEGEALTDEVDGAGRSAADAMPNTSSEPSACSSTSMT